MEGSVQVWLNFESGIELKKYTIEIGFYLMQWKFSIRLTEGGLKTISLGPLYLSIWDNDKLRAWHDSLIKRTNK
jgi:hypothetical protein